jgi:hypothetical protein
LQDSRTIQAQNSGVGATRAACPLIAHFQKNNKINLGVQAVGWRQKMAVVVFDEPPLKI